MVGLARGSSRLHVVRECLCGDRRGVAHVLGLELVAMGCASLDGDSGHRIPRRKKLAVRSLITAEDRESADCIADGGQHDFRRWDGWDTLTDNPRTYWRCVWCHVAACGKFGEFDPCWIPVLHKESHLSRKGFSWPLGVPRI